MVYKNPKDQRANSKKWYSRNKDRHILNKDRRRKELREWVIGLKSDLECERCGESDWRCLDFHHKDNNKFKSISDMITDGDSKDRILIEIDKCEVVCANCHRKETLNYL